VFFICKVLFEHDVYFIVFMGRLFLYWTSSPQTQAPTRVWYEACRHYASCFALFYWVTIPYIPFSVVITTRALRNPKLGKNE
jgi:hypothetical protein